MAQKVIYCDLCENTPAQMHCDPCIANLCKACVGDHILEEQSKDQHVASKSHKKHDSIEPMELCNSQKEELTKKTEELETTIHPSYESSISDLEERIETLPEDYEELLRDISKQGEEWHKEIDIIINKLKAEAEEIKNQNLEILKKHLAEMKSLGSQIRKEIWNIKELLRLNNIKDIMAYESRFPKFEFPPPTVDIKHCTFMKLPIQGEQLLKMFGMIEQKDIYQPKQSHQKKPSTITPKVVRCQDTGYKHLCCVKCVRQNEFWVLDIGFSSNIKFFPNSGLTKKFNIPNNAMAEGITVSKEGDLVWTNTLNSSINKMKNGSIEKIVTTGSWKPKKISYTASGDLLVCMSKNDEHGKVVLYSDSTEKQVIQYDDLEKPLFSKKELFICENKNRNICVSDTGAKRVVVLNRTGKLRFHYSGNLSSQKYKSFTPTGITTDILCQILIADRHNNCVHIIARDGKFICYVNNCELSQPYDLSIDEQDFLYVAEYTGKVKVIKYLTG